MIKKKKMASDKKDEFIRATYIIKKEYAEKLKALSYWERKDIKLIINEILGDYFKNKEVKPVKIEEL